MLVNDAHQPEEFEKRVLERRGGQKQLVERRKSTLDRIADFVCGLVDVSEPMGFINDGQVPCDLTDVWLF